MSFSTRTDFLPCQNLEFSVKPELVGVLTASLRAQREWLRHPWQNGGAELSLYVCERLEYLRDVKLCSQLEVSRRRI